VGSLAKHRILLFNHYAGSPKHGMEYRPFYFARAWQRAGHRVLVVAASYTHLRQANPQVAGVTARETLEGVDYLWVRSPRYRGNGIGRVANMLSYLAGVYGPCRRAIVEFRPDLVIASSTYTWDNWLAAHYSRKSGARYVYEVHDIWPATPMELGGMSPRHPFIWTLQKAEDFACRRADKVISLLPGAREHMMERGMPADRFAYVPNGVVPEEWSDKQPVPAGHMEAIRAFRMGRRCVVGYVGGHGLSNALDTLIEAAADPRLKDIGIICVGKGPEKARLAERARASGAAVLFLDPVPGRSVPAMLALFDGLFIGWMRSPLYRFGISPNKLFEYMMAGVPIVHAVDAANDPVKEAGSGVSVAPENVGALCEGILALAGLSPGERRRMGERGRRFVTDHHMVDTLAQQFLDAVWSSTVHGGNNARAVTNMTGRGETQ
jgi:glycosyltransferase involved in cell wall biosynthesis